MWISGSRKLDIGILGFSGLIGLFLYEIVKGNTLALIIYGFILTQFFDAGHNYVTFWRTFFKRATSKDKIYFLLLFLFCFLVIYSWLALKIPYFWAFFLYFTFFHHIRQYYGISRWYQKLNNRSCPKSNFFLYALTISPFILFHFRNFPTITNFPKVDLFKYPDPQLFKIGIFAYAIILIGWIIHEYTLYSNGKREFNRFLSIFMPGLLHFIIFLLASDFLQILFPLFLVHGLSYIFLMGITLDKLEFKKGHFIPLVAGSAVLFGLADYLYRHFILHENYGYLIGKSNFDILILALITTPAIFHYFSDGVIWTGQNADMRLLFTRENT